MSNDAMFKELQEEFLKESLSLIERFEYVLLNNTSLDVNLVNELFRIAHSIKGGASAVGLKEVSEFTHKYEDFLSQFRTDPAGLSAEIISVLLEFSDYLRNYFVALCAGLPADWDPEPLILRIGEVSSGNSQSTEPSQVEEHLHEHESSNSITTPVSVVASDDSKQSIKKTKKPSEQVKVDLHRLESIFETIGEVVVFKNQLKSSITKSASDFDHLDVLVKDLYDKALGLRMTSLQPLFQRLQRTLRDLSIKLNKPTEIKINGEETEIDRNLFEQLPDPLIHLVRNAIDHGIETSEVRRENSKSPKATIELKAYYESGQVIIEIIDDGKGIDTEVIYNKCVSKGLIPSQKPITDYTQEQIFQFIFLPGFSTAKEVSDLSGRGVGLDVVKTTLEKFHGKISVSSKKGFGSSFKMHLPLTTSLIDGITFISNSKKYIIPNSSIHSIDFFEPSDFSVAADRRRILKKFETPIVCVDVGNYFGHQLSENAKKVGVRSFIDNKQYCFLFDGVGDQCQVVVKPLPSNAKSTDFIGAAVANDGHAHLILDLNSILKNHQVKANAA